MNTLEAIAGRRSIRKFKDAPVSDEDIEAILNAGSQAPSGKNRQPWRFVVVKEDKRAEMVRTMRASIDQLEEHGVDIGSAKWTANVMDHAPVTIFVFNAHGEHTPGTPPWDDEFDVVDVQSIGAAIQNMLLAALDLGLGSLWICDVLYAYDALCDLLKQERQMIAAVSFGYPDEQPGPRPRKPLSEVATWL
ncbi:MAG: nitroreductase family protein [Anaerolineae bacterium]|nr:nitroreductase family protein [Anaerolineae bacterium]